MTTGAEGGSGAEAGRRAGALLAKARGKAKLTIADVAAKTRIPQRHLEAIEAGDYARLPSRTYAIGFSRTYARMLGLDEREVTEQVRLDLEQADPASPARPDRFEPGDPARLPSRRLAWLSALAVLVLVVGAFSFYRTYFSPGLGPAPLTAPTPAQAAPRAAGPSVAAAPAVGASGPVVFTSLADGTWVKFYDGAGKRLFEGQMARGQTFTVPADAANPQVWTGRPNMLGITIAGRPVATLGEEEVVMRDVPVSAAALLARTAAPRPAAPAASAP
ncbi:helix-turn-helix domain-containing protein [Qipengyuania sediminis]|uniref:helix-turn-helix domain-containing protein n=1 Tax=Qipengyuania sediminis TaxID=1532023 RepID=UPI00105AAE0A|nr:helix-turn-helix domain-containing protein [Qipengyuania sediminis]